MIDLSSAARALAERLAGRAEGAVVLVDFLEAQVAEQLCEAVEPLLPGWHAVVVGTPEDARRSDEAADPIEGGCVLTEDAVVSLREDLDQRLLVFLPVGFEASGLQGVRSTAEMVAQADLLERANRLLLRDIAGRDPARAACCEQALRAWKGRRRPGDAGALRIHRYLRRAREVGAGAALHLLGWIPDGGAEQEAMERLARNRACAERLLPRHGGPARSVRERVDGLLLADGGLAAQLEAFLAAREPDAIEAWGPELLAQRLGFERWRFDAHRVDRLEVRPFRNPKTGKVGRWSGLRAAGEEGAGRLEFVVCRSDPERMAKQRLTVRWSVAPSGVPRGAVHYLVGLYATGGAEPLVERLVPHRGAKVQSVGIPAADLVREDGDGLPFEVVARVEVEPGTSGRDGSHVSDESEPFWVVEGEAEEEAVSGRAEAVRCLGEALLWAATRGIRAPRPTFFRARQKDGPRWGVRFGPHQAVLRRSPVLASLEADLLACEAGRLPSGEVRLDRGGRVLRFEVGHEQAPEELEALLDARARLLGSLCSGERHPLLTDWNEAPRDLERLRAYLHVWRTLLARSPVPAGLWRVDACTVRDASGKVAALLLSPFHPFRILWTSGYEAFLGRVREAWRERGGAPSAWKGLVGILREVLDGRNLPPLAPAEAASGSSRDDPPLVCADVFEAAWSLYLPVDTAYPGEALDRLRRGLGVGEEDGRRGALHAWLVSRVRDFVQSGSGARRLLVATHAFGDGEALDAILHEGTSSLETPPPRVRVDFLRSSDRSTETFFDRAAGGRVGSRLLERATERTASVFRPEVEWRVRSAEEPVADVHLAFVGDLLETAPDVVVDRAEPGDAVAYGLVLPTRLRWRHGVGGWDRWWRPWHGEGQQHLKPYTRRMRELLEAWLRALLAAIRDDPPEHAWPAVKVVFRGAPEALLEELHDRADWIFLLDRRVTPELHLRASEADGPAATLIEVHGAPGTDLGGALLVSRVRRPLLQARLARRLGELGSADPASAASAVLARLQRLGGPFQVRAMTGREGADRAILAAAVGRHPSLEDGVQVAADFLGLEHVDLLHLAVRGGELHLRPLLLPGRSDHEAAEAEEELQGLVASARPDRGDELAGLRRLRIGRALHPALQVAGPEHRELCGAVEGLLKGAATSGGPHLLVDPVWTVGWDQAMGEGGGLADLAVGRRELDALTGVGGPPVADLAVGRRELDALTGVGGPPEPPQAPQRPGPSVAPVRGASLPGEVRLVLGRGPGGGLLEQALTTRASPHALLVGMTGSGKTTLLVHLVRDMARSGCGVLVVAFHDDLVERVRGSVGPDARILRARREGLPLDPLSVEGDPAERWTRQDRADRANAVAETWATVFGGLGDVQKGLLRAAGEWLFQESDRAGRSGRVEFWRFREALERVSRRERRRTAGHNLLPRLALFDQVFVAGEELAPERLFGRTTVVDASGYEGDEVVRGIACFTLEHVFRKVRASGQTDAMRLVVVLDEAHLAARLATLTRIAREGRKFGLAIVLASQEVSDFPPEVRKNAGLQVALSMDSREARAMVASWTSEARRARRLAEHISRMQPYHALVRTLEGSIREVALLPPDESPWREGDT